MKLSKRKMTILSFSVGACLFVSTAFADALLGSGYDRLKDSIKLTAEQMESGLNNYTVEMLIAIKENDRIIEGNSITQKFDTVGKANEDRSVTQYANGKTREHYSYRDEEKSIWKNGSEEKYYVTEFESDSKQRNYQMFTNPFNEPGAREMEKIIDALVGNLKEHVQAEETVEGGKSYSGSLTATQVPALVNAVSSFAVKQMIRDQNRHGEAKIEEIESDVYVNSVTGTAVENKDGILEHLTGDIVLSGKDKNGVERQFSLSVVYNLTDIGSTKVKEPNLSGAKVEKVSEYSGSLNEKHIGTYKNNIVIEKDGQIVKIGERTIVIDAAKDGHVSGSFTETVYPGYEADYPNPHQFSFDYKHRGSMPLFTYENADGKQENGRIDTHEVGRLYVELGIEVIDENSWRSDHRPHFDPHFNRVFDEE